MKVTETFRISFKALGDRKVRTSLTILMVIVGSSLMVTLNGIVAGLGQFATDVFNRLAPNLLFITSIPTDDSVQGDDDDGDNGGPPSFLGQGLIPVPAITLDQVVVGKLRVAAPRQRRHPFVPGNNHNCCREQIPERKRAIGAA